MSASQVDEFYQFIRKHESGRDTMTHTTLQEYGKRYCFDGKRYMEFLRKYTNLVKYYQETNQQHKSNLHFVERPDRNGVTFLFIDVDYDHKGTTRLYHANHIKQIISHINQIMIDKFMVTSYQLMAFVTEKAQPTRRNEDTSKDGFHIYYPYLPMQAEYRGYVIDRLCELLRDKKLLQGIEYQNDSGKVFDKSIIQANGIVMYGSKKEGHQPYLLTNVYDKHCNHVDAKRYDIEELIGIFSNQQYDRDAGIVAREPIQSIEQAKKQAIDATRSDRPTQAINTTQSTMSFDALKHDKVSKKAEIELAKQLCEALSKKRASDYKTWWAVGCALHNVSDTLYDTFVTFSKNDMAKYNDKKITCKDVWGKASQYKNEHAIYLLRYWAKQDNKKKYYDILCKLNEHLFKKAETGKHADIAQIIYELYKDRFVCVNIERKKWFEFKNHRWVEIPSAYTLEDIVSGEFKEMWLVYIQAKMQVKACEMKEQQDQQDDQEDVGADADADADSHKKEYEKYYKMLKILDNLGDVRFRGDVIRACANKFIDTKFNEKLNTNVYLVGFENGVWDLRDESFGFRDGLPSDCLSMSVGYDWKEYDAKDPVFDKIRRYFAQLMVDEDMREYLLVFLASCLRGVPDQKFHIWTGGGGNGKSATIDLLKNMLGDYFGVVPVTILTRKRGSSSSATPEMADKNGKRVLIIQEPEYNDVIYVGQMKEFSGTDTIMARALYGDPFYYIPQFKMIMTCNNKPEVPASDDGTWRRMKVTPYESRFVDENPAGAREFLKDEELQEDFPKWAQPLMWLLITMYYPMYARGYGGKRYKIVEPAKVTEFTREYKKEADVYMTWLDEKVQKTDNEQDSEQLSMLYDMFRDWYRGNYAMSPPPKKNLVLYLQKMGYKMDKLYVKGIKLLM